MKTAHDPKPVKNGGGSVVLWACVAANSGCLGFTNGVAPDKSVGMNSDVSKAGSSA